MNTRLAIEHFWHLADSGKSAALDVHTVTGEIVVRCTKSAAGVEGNGTVPAAYGDEWARLVTSNAGTITRGAER